MQVGTEILLARMKEYPDEFFTGNYGGGRWTGILDDARQYLPKEDVEALDEGHRQMQVDRFNERVLARLAGEDKPEVEEKLFGPQAAIKPLSVNQQMMKQRSMLAQIAAQQSQYASGLQNSLHIGANGIAAGDWLTGGHK